LRDDRRVHVAMTRVPLRVLAAAREAREAHRLSYPTQYLQDAHRGTHGQHLFVLAGPKVAFQNDFDTRRQGLLHNGRQHRKTRIAQKLRMRRIACAQHI
jgi:hypothetical protein